MQEVPELDLDTSLSSVVELHADKTTLAPGLTSATQSNTLSLESFPDAVTPLTFDDIFTDEDNESFEDDDNVFLSLDLKADPEVECLVSSVLDPGEGAVLVSDRVNSQAGAGVAPELQVMDVDLSQGCLDDLVCQTPSLDLDLDLDLELEPRLKEALARSEATRCLGPLLKEELRLKILKKRHDSGEDDIEVNFDDAPRYELTAEEYAKRDRRRAQNRGAAKRFRARKKSEELEIKKKLEEEQKLNERLVSQKVRLQQEVQRLRQTLEQHYTDGRCVFFASWSACRAAPVAVDSWTMDFRNIL